MIAAIGVGDQSPVVWGLGETSEDACADADSQDQEYAQSWRSDGMATCEISPEIAARIEDGEISCDTLGITVRFRDGEIVGAEVRS